MIDEVRLIELPVINDVRGNLTFVESERQIPFELKRVFYLYDVPGGSSRAGHALRTCHQLLVAVSGSGAPLPGLTQEATSTSSRVSQRRAHEPSRSPRIAESSSSGR